MRRSFSPPAPAQTGPGTRDPHPAEAYAGLLRRLAAFALDWLVIAVYIVLLTVVTLLIGSGLGASAVQGLANPVLSNAIAFLTLILPVILYFTLLESGPGQDTWGKRKLGLRVRRMDGGRLSRGQAAGRAVGKFLPWQLAHTCLFAIPGWPLAPTAPAWWVMAGFAAVWIIVGADLATLGLTATHRTPYDW